MNGTKAARVARMLLVSLAAVALAWSGVRADTITLTDGTKIEGRVIKQEGQYWVKTADGESRMIPAEKVQSLVRSEVKTVPGEAPRTGASPEYLQTRRTAEAMLVAADAARLWQTFIAAHPGSADLPAAQAELLKWKALNDAEKIRGRWLAGPERLALIEKAAALAKQAADDVQQSRSLQAIEHYKEAVKVYPNDYTSNFALGYLSLIAKQNEESIPYFEQAVRLRPQSVGALNNLAIALWETKKFDRAMIVFLEAAQKGDTLLLAKNLQAALNLTPRDQVGAARMKEMVAASSLLGSKYQLQPGKELKFWLEAPAVAGAAGAGGSDSPAPGDTISGTGFLISADGLILTNRHVAAFGNRIIVRTSDGKDHSAAVVHIDEEQDLALLRIEPIVGSPRLEISRNDLPNEGAVCFALGFPMIDRMGSSLKITQGIVSGLRPEQAADILIDAKVNPGNSGGPLVDRYGQVIGIVTQKSRSTEREDSYGLALSAAKIRRFFKKMDLSLGPVAPGVAALSAEEIVGTSRAAVVCILVTNGPPTSTRPTGLTATLRPPNPARPNTGPANTPSTETAPPRPTPPRGAHPPATGWGDGDSAPGQRVVDLMPLWSLPRDRVSGEWGLADGKVTCTAVNACQRIRVPYVLPEEYDLRVEWSQPEILHGVFLGLSQNQHGFEWIIEPTAGRPCGFNTIGGRDVMSNPNSTRFVSPGLVADQHYTTVVRVRKDGVKGYLNGELKAEYASKDFSEFAPPAYRRVKDETVCYLGAYDSTVFYKAELVEVTGTGHPAR